MCCSSTPQVLFARSTSRLRRDAYSLEEEEEESWFDEQDEFDDAPDVSPASAAATTTMLTPADMEFVFGGKVVSSDSSDFDPIGKFLERSHSPGRVFTVMYLSNCSIFVCPYHDLTRQLGSN